jgi:hypothetical protein
VRARITILIVCLVTALAFATAASAQTPSQNAYGGVQGQVSGGSPPSNTTVTANDAGGSLPFTGLQVGLVLAGGLTLLGAGLVVRRASAGPR